MALSDKALLFAAEYGVDLNGTQAAIRAGYSAKTAAQTAYKLLQMDEIKAILAENSKQRFERIKIDEDFVLQGLARIARANATDLIRIDPTTGRVKIDFRNASPECLETISSVEEEEFVERNELGEFEKVRKTRFKLHDKLSAFNSLGRHLKLFTDRIEVEEVSDPKEKLKDFIRKKRAAAKE